MAQYKLFSTFFIIREGAPAVRLFGALLRLDITQKQKGERRNEIKAEAEKV